MLLVLLLPFLLMWSLGGFALGSFVFIWAFFAPIAALIYENRQKGMYWFYAFLGLVVISSLIDQTLIESTQYAIPQIAIELFFFLNVSAGLAGVFFLIRYFINEKEENANVRLEREHNALLEKSKELKEANAQLSYYANHDALTKLPNRYFLYKVLDEKIKIAMHNNRTMAVIFIDLDGFKEVNNSYGHSVGDKLLSTVASRLNALVNENDLIARVGGDEFVLIMSNIDKLTEVTQKAEDIIQTVNDDYPFLSSDMQVGVSIGISLFPKHSNDIDELIDFADKAMYTVKEGVKNSYLFYEENMNSDQIKD